MLGSRSLLLLLLFEEVDDNKEWTLQARLGAAGRGMKLTRFEMFEDGADEVNETGLRTDVVFVVAVVTCERAEGEG